jgi:diaminohydroxyphosphoribosylaminopyrimidine deaminase/5-amino-6-(5-phosphoribosylamino)uracil reductase
MKAVYQLQLQTVLVEGGAQLLQSFIDTGLWDEARVIENEKLKIESGLNAPQLSNNQLIQEQLIVTDKISYYKNLKSSI